MFKSFFGLVRDPFSLNPDPAFLYANAATRSALTGLIHGILNRRNFVVLTGESGTGKSTLLRAAISQIPKEQLNTSLVFNPLLTADDFLEYAMADFGIDPIASSKSRRILQLQEFLLEHHQAGKISLLMVDEAHLLTPLLLEEIRLLTNFETSECKLLQIVLAGHSDLDQMLDRPDLRQLKQRIGVRVSLQPLSGRDVRAYMENRWAKAGGSRLPFEPAAIAEIVQASRGIPRLINSISDNALIMAYGSHQSTITGEMIQDIRSGMKLDGVSSNGSAPTPQQVSHQDDLDLVLPSLQPRSLPTPVELEDAFIDVPKFRSLS